LAKGTKKFTSTGGMTTKIEAAKISTSSGIPCVIANGRKELSLLRVIKEKDIGTLFLPKKKGLLARKRWIAFGSKPKGRVFVDRGAKEALIGGKSLLSVGITDIEGEFQKDDVVSILDSEFREFARGRVKFSSSIIKKIKGKKYPDEVIHRDNLVIL
jgi:glutamate 5-kinase